MHTIGLGLSYIEKGWNIDGQPRRARAKNSLKVASVSAWHWGAKANNTTLPSSNLDSISAVFLARCYSPIS